MAAEQAKIPNINKGIYNGFSLLLKAICIRVGPKNISARAMPIFLRPRTKRSLLVLSVSIIIGFYRGSNTAVLFQ